MSLLAPRRPLSPSVSWCTPPAPPPQDALAYAPDNKTTTLNQANIKSYIHKSSSIEQFLESERLFFLFSPNLYVVCNFTYNKEFFQNPHG